MIIWRAVETASQVVSGIGMWDRVPANMVSVPNSGHWSFRRKFRRDKHQWLR